MTCQNVNEIRWCDHSSAKTCLEVLLHRAITFQYFSNQFLEFLIILSFFILLLQVQVIMIMHQQRHVPLVKVMV